MLKKIPLRAPTDATLPNNGNGYYPQDILKAYNFPTDLTGKGQVVGILEFSNGYNIQDAVKFWQAHGITPPTVTFVSVDGTPNDNGTSFNDLEASLDLQWVGALAPGAHLVVYESNGGQTYEQFTLSMTNALTYILKQINDHDPLAPSVLSISYGDAEATWGTQAVQQWGDLIAQLDALGTTVVVASGDQGAYGMHDLNGPKVVHADAPATAPYAIAVGGTTLLPNGPETAWTYMTAADMGATGGGYSSVYGKPGYQTTVSGTSLGVPVVAFNADPATGYEIYFQGQAFPVGGTSVAAPVFAAVMARANERRGQHNKSLISNLNAWLYENADQGFFRDVTVGNNSYNGVIGYPAQIGWDACTGWGSMDVDRFITSIAGPAPTPVPVPTPTPQESWWTWLINVFKRLFGI